MEIQNKTALIRNLGASPGIKLRVIENSSFLQNSTLFNSQEWRVLCWLKTIITSYKNYAISTRQYRLNLIMEKKTLVIKQWKGSQIQITEQSTSDQLKLNVIPNN